MSPKGSLKSRISVRSRASDMGGSSSARKITKTIVRQRTIFDPQPVEIPQPEEKSQSDDYSTDMKINYARKRYEERRQREKEHREAEAKKLPVKQTKSTSNKVVARFLTYENGEFY